jgi:hypothetical protein
MSKTMHESSQEHVTRPSEVDPSYCWEPTALLPLANAPLGQFAGYPLPYHTKLRGRFSSAYSNFHHNSQTTETVYLQSLFFIGSIY